MSSDTVFLIVEASAALLLAALAVVTVAVFLYAYMRCRQLLFLVLCVGSIVSAFGGLYIAGICYQALTHVRLLPASVMYVIGWADVVVIPIGGVISFIGSVLLVRSFLRLYSQAGDLTKRSSQPLPGEQISA